MWVETHTSFPRGVRLVTVSNHFTAAPYDLETAQHVTLKATRLVSLALADPELLLIQSPAALPLQLPAGLKLAEGVEVAKVKKEKNLYCAVFNLRLCVCFFSFSSFF